MLKLLSATTLISTTLLLAACSSGSSKGGTGAIISPAQPIANTPEAAQKQILEVKEQINSDVQYALHEDDLETLVSEGLVEDTEIKAWVK